MAGWHHWLDGCEFEWTPEVGDGQGGLTCCDSWGCKESDTTEQLKWTELNWTEFEIKPYPTSLQIFDPLLLFHVKCASLFFIKCAYIRALRLDLCAFLIVLFFFLFHKKHLFSWFHRYRFLKRKTIQYNYPQKYPQTISAGGSVERRKVSCTVGANVNWYSHYGE